MYKIISKKGESGVLSTTIDKTPVIKIIQSIKSQFGCTSQEAREIVKNMDPDNVPHDLAVALDPFYNLEYVEEPAELYWGKYPEPDSEEDIKEANEWLDGLSEKEKRFVEVIVSQKSIGPACG